MRILRDYEGREVRLTDERFAHILEHPEMVGLEVALSRRSRTRERPPSQPTPADIRGDLIIPRGVKDRRVWNTAPHTLPARTSSGTEPT